MFTHTNIAIERGIMELNRRGYVKPCPVTYVITDHETVLTLPFDFMAFPSREDALLNFNQITRGFGTKGIMLLFFIYKGKLLGGEMTEFDEGLFVYSDYENKDFAIFQETSFDDTCKVIRGEKIIYDENSDSIQRILSDFQSYIDFDQLDYSAPPSF